MPQSSFLKLRSWDKGLVSFTNLRSNIWESIDDNISANAFNDMSTIIGAYVHPCDVRHRTSIVDTGTFLAPLYLFKLTVFKTHGRGPPPLELLRSINLLFWKCWLGRGHHSWRWTCLNCHSAVVHIPRRDYLSWGAVRKKICVPDRNLSMLLCICRFMTVLELKYKYFVLSARRLQNASIRQGASKQTETHIN